MVRVWLHENCRTVLSGTTADSTDCRPEVRLIAFSPILNTSSTMFSTESLSRPPFAPCSTQRTLSIRPMLRRSSTTTLPRGTTIRQPKKYHYGFGCTLVSTGVQIPIRSSHRSRDGDSCHVWRARRRYISLDFGDSARDILDWHDHLLAPNVVPIAPYNLRSTDGPKEIKHRIEDPITEYSEDVQLKQSILDEAYNNRTGIERTNNAVKDCGLGCSSADVPEAASTHVQKCSCHCVSDSSLQSPTTSGDDPGQEKLTL